MVSSFHFTTLPTSVGRNILSNWLNAKSLGKLDVAYCSRSERALFLEHLTDCETLDKDFLAQLLVSRLSWMTTRNVKCATFNLHAKTPFKGVVDWSVVSAFFQSTACKLRNVRIHSDHATIDALLDLVSANKCTLQNLTVQSHSFQPRLPLTVARNTVLQNILRNSVDTLTEFQEHFLERWPSIVVSGLSFSSLRVLDINISCDEDLLNICRAAPNIQEMILSTPICSNLGLSTIAEYCKSLTSLDVSAKRGHGPERIDEGGMAAIAKSCRNLNVLSLSNCEQLTDSALITIATHCANLSELKVTTRDIGLITDASLYALAHGKFAESLRVLELEGCRTITGAGILEIAKHCPHLKELNLSDTSVELMTTLPAAIPYLKNVHIFQLSQNAITDEVLESIGEHMSALEDLDISEGDNYYTTTGLMSIALNCEKLKVLYVNENMEGLNDLVVAVWQKLRPGLKFY